MDDDLTPRMRQRLERWRREGRDGDELQQRAEVLALRRPDLEAVKEGRAGEVEIDRMAGTSAWVEPSMVRLAMEELSPEAIESRLRDAVAARDDLDRVFDTMATEPFPTAAFLGELYGWAHPDRAPIQAPWTPAGLGFFGLDAGGGYEAMRRAFVGLVEAVGEERAAPELPVAYEVDALFEQLAESDLQALTTEDIAVLGLAAPGPEGVGAAARRDLDHVWAKAEGLAGELGTRLLGEGAHVALWPWHEDGEGFPFLWIRMKAAGRGDWATHLGVFVSAGHCNACVDLERDAIVEGTAREKVDDVLDFYRSRVADALPSDTPGNLQAWTDGDNVVSLREFLDADLDAFMEANQDEDHPWPKLGYVLEVDEITAMGGRWVEECARLLEPLVPVYLAITGG